MDKRTKKIVEKVLEDKSVATKMDITKVIADNNHKLFKILVTKEDLNNYVTKEDLRESTDRLLTAMDRIYGVVKKNDEEQTVIGHNVQNHEVRITKIERAAFSN